MFSSPPHVSRIAALPAAVIVVSSDPGEGVQSTTTDRIQRLPVDVITARWVGDLDGMVERRRVRLLTPYTKTHYFIDRGQRGIVYDFGTRLEEEINRVLKTRPATRVHVVFVPTPRNELFQALLDGRGDIISSNVTITAAHATSVDLTTPGETDVRQILVSGSTRRAIQTTRDVGGMEVAVRDPSTELDSLIALNRRLEQQSIAPIVINRLPPELEDEAVLEMVSAGLLRATVVDDVIGDSGPGCCLTSRFIEASPFARVGHTHGPCERAARNCSEC